MMPFEPSWASVLLESAARGSLLLLAALGAAAMMRRSSAAARHAVWLAALSGVLALPVLMVLLPDWRVLPLGASFASAAVQKAAHEAAPPFAADVGAATPGGLVDPAAAPAPVPEAAAAVGAGVQLPADAWAPALVLWLLVAGLLAARLVYGLARVRWIERHAAELTDEPWVRMTDTLARRLGVGRIVRLLRHPGAAVPMTWGILSPVVVLPESADRWDEERRRVVLAHELAHVRRRDTLTQWVAHAAVVLFWFNPLVWLAARRLRQEREQACDEAVLEIGTPATAYADHLLSLVRSLGSAPAPAAALAMARRSQFEGRLLAILDRGGAARGGRAVALGACVLLLAAAVPLATLRPVVAAPAPPSVLASVAEPADPPPADGTPAPDLDAELPPAGEPPPVVEAAAPPLAAALGVILETRAAGVADPEVYDKIIRMAHEIASPVERRQLLVSLLERPDISSGNVIGILDAARTMRSDVERRFVLTRAVQHRAFTDEALPAYLAAVSELSSSIEQRISLAELLQRRRLSTPALAATLRVSAEIGSGIERRTVLTTAVATQRVDGAAREAYLESARTISSEVERAAALSALLGPETRTVSRTSTRTTQTVEHPRPAGRDDIRGAGQERKWDSVLDLEQTRDGRPRVVRLRATDMFFRSARSNPHRIGPKGELYLEERWDGTVRVVRALPGEGGRPVFTYTVDGVEQPFDSAARGWMERTIAELTGR